MQPIATRPSLKRKQISASRNVSMRRILTKAVVLTTNGLRVTGDAMRLVSIVEGSAKRKFFTS